MSSLEVKGLLVSICHLMSSLEVKGLIVSICHLLSSLEVKGLIVSTSSSHSPHFSIRLVLYSTCAWGHACWRMPSGTVSSSSSLAHLSTSTPVTPGILTCWNQPLNPRASYSRCNTQQGIINMSYILLSSQHLTSSTVIMTASYIQRITRGQLNAGFMLGQRFRRWPNVKPTLSHICVGWDILVQPSKHETLTQCWFNVGPPSTTLGH